MIPVTELARRICVARHPFIAQTGAAVPCAEDTRTAQLSYGLLTEHGAPAFEVLLNARLEADDAKAVGAEAGVQGNLLGSLLQMRDVASSRYGDLRGAATAALSELGEPGPETPAPVANAVLYLRAGLDGRFVAAEYHDATAVDDGTPRSEAELAIEAGNRAAEVEREDAAFDAAANENGGEV